MPSTSLLVLVPFFFAVAVVGVFCYPVERRKFMLYNARVNVVLTGETRYSKIKLKNEFAFKKPVKRARFNGLPLLTLVVVFGFSLGK